MPDSEIASRISSVEYCVWGGGTPFVRIADIETSLTATDWRDSKGQLKKGALKWQIMKTPVPLKFSKTHTFSPGGNGGAYATITKAGRLSAKAVTKETTVYVYAIDTGSEDYEIFKVTIKPCPTRLAIMLTAPDGAQSSVKKVVLSAGESAMFTAVPINKTTTGEVSRDNTYSISVPQSLAPCIKLEEQGRNEAGYPVFTVTGLGTLKNKATQVTVTVTNDQSGKKGTVTVVLVDSVTGASAVPDKQLEKKNSKISAELKLVSGDGDALTTDKLSVIACKGEPVISGTKVITKNDQSVGVKLSADRKTVTVTAKKDRRPEGLACWVIATDAASKTARAYKLFDIE